VSIERGKKNEPLEEIPGSGSQGFFRGRIPEQKSHYFASLGVIVEDEKKRKKRKKERLKAVVQTLTRQQKMKTKMDVFFERWKGKKKEDLGPCWQRLSWT
jgi:hypothetical protein